VKIHKLHAVSESIVAIDFDNYIYLECPALTMQQ
jgi:hypothetical protein